MCVCIDKKVEEREAIINRGWMELVFLGHVPMVPYLATCTTRVCAGGEDEVDNRDRWIAIKREDIDFHLNASVPLSPPPSFSYVWARTCRPSIKRRILPGLWCLDARLIKFVDPLHGQILRDMVKLWIGEEEAKGWRECETRMRRGEGWWERGRLWKVIVFHR